MENLILSDQKFRKELKSAICDSCCEVFKCNSRKVCLSDCMSSTINKKSSSTFKFKLWVTLCSYIDWIILTDWIRQNGIELPCLVMLQFFFTCKQLTDSTYYHASLIYKLFWSPITLWLLVNLSVPKNAINSAQAHSSTNLKKDIFLGHPVYSLSMLHNCCSLKWNFTSGNLTIDEVTNYIIAMSAFPCNYSNNLLTYWWKKWEKTQQQIMMHPL